MVSTEEAKKTISQMIMRKEHNSKIISYVSDVLMKLYIFKTIRGRKYDEMYVYKNGIFEYSGRQFVEEKAQEILNGSSTQVIREILKRIERKTYISRTDIGNPPLNLICVNNGVLDISDFGNVKKLDHDPKYGFMNKFDIDYDPEASCDKIMNLIHEIAKESDINCLQEVFGDLLQRTYKFKRAVIFKGPHDSGKSQIIKILNKFVGDGNYSGTNMQNLAEGKWQIYKLYNKYANICDEVSEEAMKDVNTFKYITGGSPIDGEIKHGDTVSFTNYAKLFFACNKIPNCKNSSNDEAYFNRWLLFEFDNKFKPEDKGFIRNIGEKITTNEELSGLLNWALEGLRRLETFNKFSYTKTWQDNKKIIQMDSNSAISFINNVTERSSENIIKKSELYQFYKDFAEFNSLDCFSSKQFNSYLTDYCTYVIEYGNGKMFWKGLKVNEGDMFIGM